MTTILIVFAFVLLVLAGVGVSGHPRLSLGWLGLACWVAAEHLVPLL